MTNIEAIKTWASKNGKISLTFENGLNLTVRQDGKLAGFNLSAEKAQELVNRLTGKQTWN